MERQVHDALVLTEAVVQGTRGDDCPWDCHCLFPPSIHPFPPHNDTLEKY